MSRAFDESGDEILPRETRTRKIRT